MWGTKALRLKAFEEMARTALVLAFALAAAVCGAAEARGGGAKGGDTIRPVEAKVARAGPAERRQSRENARLRAEGEQLEGAARATGATGSSAGGSAGGSAAPVSDEEVGAELARAEKKEDPDGAEEHGGGSEQQPVALAGAEETVGELNSAQERVDKEEGEPTGTGPFGLPDISYVPDPRKHKPAAPARKQKRRSRCPERCGDDAECPCSPGPTPAGACGEDRSGAACIHPAPTGGVTGATAAYAWPDVTGATGARGLRAGTASKQEGA